MLFKSLIANGGFKVLGGLYLGWGIGANDSANIFGTAVATNVIRFRNAIILIAIFVVIGSMVEGPGLYEHMSFSSETGTNLALAATLAAALTVTLITYLSIPTSTSQAAVGAFMGIAISVSGIGGVQWSKFLTMLICWIINPIACIILCIALLKGLGVLISITVKSRLVRDRIYKFGLIIFGCYGAYALGANNVVVTTAPYYHAGMFGPAGRNQHRPGSFNLQPESHGHDRKEDHPALSLLRFDGGNNSCSGAPLLHLAENSGFIFSGGCGGSHRGGHLSRS